jgi:hypothetical protein
MPLPTATSIGISLRFKNMFIKWRKSRRRRRRGAIAALRALVDGLGNIFSLPYAIGMPAGWSVGMRRSRAMRVISGRRWTDGQRWGCRSNDEAAC